MIGSWLSQMAGGNASYLQLFWLLQTGRVTALAVYRLLTRHRPSPSQTDLAERKRGLTEFRKQ